MKCRWDDCGSHEDPLHGWDINRTRQLHHLSDSKMSSTNCPSWWGHNHHVPLTASPWDLWPVWGYHSALRGPYCLPGTKRACAWLLWQLWLPVSGEEGHCRFSAGGRLIHWLEVEVIACCWPLLTADLLSLYYACFISWKDSQRTNLSFLLNK